MVFRLWLIRRRAICDPNVQEPGPEGGAAEAFGTSAFSYDLQFVSWKDQGFKWPGIGASGGWERTKLYTGNGRLLPADPHKPSGTESIESSDSRTHTSSR